MRAMSMGAATLSNWPSFYCHPAVRKKSLPSLFLRCAIDRGLGLSDRQAGGVHECALWHEQKFSL